MPQKPGTLLSLRLQNFGPHNDAHFSFPSALNIIVAPNGSGKSTIVNAIALVFGGTTKIMNRANTLDQFVKDGEREATITVEIVSPSHEQMLIKRQITRGNQTAPPPTQNRKRGAVEEAEVHRSSTKWFINDRISKEKDVADLVDQLGIQVDNLVQFLPQDRVDDFTKMTPVNLLESTEQAVGGKELLEMHHKLQRSAKALLTQHKTVDEMIRDLNSLKEQNKPLEAQIVADEHRNNLENQLSNMKNIQLVQNYQVKKAAATQAKILADEAGTALQAVETELQPLVQSHEKNQRLLSKYLDQEFPVLKKSTTEKVKQYIDIQRQVEGNFNLAENAKTSVRERLEELRQVRDQLPQLRAKYQAAKKLKEGRRPEGPDREELTALQAEITASNEALRIHSDQFFKAQQEVAQLEQQHGVLRNRLHQLQSVSERRLDSMRQSDSHSFNAAHWVRDHSDDFHKPVLGPIQTLINPSSRLAARILEASIPARDMRAFLTFSSEDQSKLAGLSRPPNNWKINVNYAGQLPDKSNPIDINPLRQFGVDAVLSDLFTCDPQLKVYLCQQFGLHSIPVCTRPGIKVDTEGIFNANRNIRVVATDEFLYQATAMRYGGGRLFTDTGLSGDVKRLGVDNVDPNLIRESEAEIARINERLGFAKAAMQKAAASREAENQKILKTKQRGAEITNYIKETHRIDMGIVEAKKALSGLKGKTIDFDRVAADAQRELDAAIVRQLKLAEEKEKIARALNDAIRKGCELAYEIRVLERLVEESSTRVCELRQNRQLRVDEKRAADKAFEKAQGEAKELAKHAQEAVRKLQEIGIDIRNHTDPVAVAREISDLSNQLDALQAPMDRQQRQLYDERCQRIKRLEEDINNDKISTDAARATLEKEGRSWRERMTNIAKELSNDFSKSMNSFGSGCSGVVVFTEPEELSNYNEYGLELRVAFRATMPQRAVSPAYQSGGERAVTALNYILALHHFTKSPFVFVDELNQGMDPVNERRSYEYLVRATVGDQATSSQFIWITPKATSLNIPSFGHPGVAMITIGRKIGNIHIGAPQPAGGNRSVDDDDSNN